MNNSSIINWDTVIGAVDYEVVVVGFDDNANPPFNSTPIATALSGGGISIVAGAVFNGLSAGPYRVQVRAIAADPANNSSYSDTVNVTYDPALTAPVNVVVT